MSQSVAIKLAISKLLDSLSSIAAALDVMHCRPMQNGVLLVHSWCCRQAAIPFLVITRPRGTCFGCCCKTPNTAMQLLLKYTSKLCPCSITTSLNADLVLCLQVRWLGIGGSPWTPFAASGTSGVASLSDTGTSLSSSSAASHKSGVFSCLMEVSCVTATFGACRLCHGHASDVICQ